MERIPIENCDNVPLYFHRPYTNPGGCPIDLPEPVVECLKGIDGQTLTMLEVMRRLVYVVPAGTRITRAESADLDRRDMGCLILAAGKDSGELQGAHWRLICYRTIEAGAVPTLHVYSPESYHGDAFIVGDRAGLMALRRALDDVLFYGADKSAFGAYVNDGEGFTGLVVLGPHSLPKVSTPYTDRETTGGSRGGDDRSPWDMVTREEYARLERLAFPQDPERPEGGADGETESG